MRKKKKIKKIILLPQVKKFVSQMSEEDQDKFLDIINAIKANPKIGKKIKSNAKIRAQKGVLLL